ncbi:MAG TPA: S8 family serine peptidase [Chitinophagaceae bacterium]|nr:S8 family serine peptidase [Chitinophagaceae bacterium]
MRFYPIPLMAFVLLLSLSVSAQDDSRFSLLLKSGTIVPPKNITVENIDNYNRVASRTNGKALAVIQFEQIPSPSERLQLKQSGIELLDYVPNNAYTATITGSLDLFHLLDFKVRSVVELTPVQKMQPELAAGIFPGHAVKVAGTVDVWISFPSSYAFEEVREQFNKKNIDVIGSRLKEYRILELRIASGRLTELASFPFVEYVQVAPGEDKPLSDLWTNWGIDGIRAKFLNAPLSVGGENLKGNGVTVGVGDDADFQQHIDFTDRLISRAAAPYNFHGTHVGGIVGGAGIRKELRAGFAPKSTIISQVFSNVFTNAAAYTADHDMVITNNSYGNILNDCNTFGFYDLYSRTLDQQAFAYPSLQNVFAAGNSGEYKCAPFPDSFRTIIGGYQSAKNVITVGNFTPIGYLYQQSSKGPVRDGRIKPEIVTIGSFITSTAPPPFNYYWENTGTSMASPAMSGGLALLYEKYKLLHGVNPKNGLMKALVCNSGDDYGNPGPDYSHGFGLANFQRALDMLKNNRYQSNSITPGPPQTININAPSGLAEIKVMLYWNDPAAAAVASQTLVNNLDLEVVDPSSNIILPLILDTAYVNIKNNAVQGVDNINNIEQVVIKNPAPGNYIIRVKPTNITQNPSQEYFVVYDFVPVETKITTPVGGETFIHGENVVVRWDSYGDPQNQFTLEFSSDDGATWSTLKNNIASNRRDYFYTAPAPNEWFVVPQVTTDKARMRITRNSTTITHTTLPFVIHDTIAATLSAVQCEGYFSIDWNSIPGATGYEIFRLLGDEMVPVATVSAATLTYTFSGLSKDSVYWASVRPIIGSTPGRRAIAVSRKPDNGNCSGSISDNDIKIDSILSPNRSGRLLTSTALGNSVPVTIRIKNLDDQSTSGNIDVSYSLNGGPVVTETINNPAIAPGSTLTHSFSAINNIDLSAANTYILEVTVAPQTPDPVTANNSQIFICKQLPNPSITGATPAVPFIDNFDAVSVQSYTSRQTGLLGLDRYDFVNSNENGRIRTFINSGIAYSGNRSLTLDSKMYNSGTVDSLTGTFNLASYIAASNDLRLDFRYKNHGQVSNAANKVWIRGNDQQNWIEVFDLAANQNPVDGTYKLSSSIELSDFLQNNSQNYSSSFQVRWGQYGQHMAADNDGGAGYTFDDIRIYEVTDDVQLISIDTPIVNSCGLSMATPVRIKVRNTSNSTLNNVPVRFRINGGSWTTEQIASIAANTTVTYTFVSSANLAVAGTYLVEAEVDYLTDDYFPNDTLSRVVINSPVITVTNSSPYLQNFEADNGSWYSSGRNATWEYGTPASYKITRAASGSKAWKTRMAGNYNDYEQSYLYSPCFDISTLTSPALSFSVAIDIEDCGAGLCDGAYVEYSTDGIAWDTLGAYNQGTNWYNKDFASGVELWSIKDYHRWHVATIPLSVIPVPQAQLTQLRFRFVFSSDASVNKEGIAIDDIHIYSNSFGIYEGLTMSSPVTQTVNGDNSWVNFLESGKLIASVKSPVTTIGSTDAQAYINTGPVRIASNQFYHDRNITIKPAVTTLADSATIRFYFLDTEMERLINATGCGFCSKPAMAYELGVTKYTNANKVVENGILADNPGGIYHFIISAKTTIVPFDKGYYAEFKANDFSEFWLNNGGINGTTSLPLKLLSFTARKLNEREVLAEWVTTDEVNVDRFELEVARGNADYQSNQFTKIGQLPARNIQAGNQYYNFIDQEPGKNGTRYYRLKMIDQDGSFKYSPIRPVVFSEDMPWSVYPNPSTGLFYLNFQLAEGEMLTLKVYDASGRTIQQQMVNGTGFLQKISIDLKANGLYMLEAAGGNKKQFFKLLKQ